MAVHNRGYYRIMRKKHINRKKRINHALNDYWNYKFEGQLSKGKIHCSCGACMAKTRNKGYKRRHIHGNYSKNLNWSHTDACKLKAMDQQIEDLINPHDVISHYPFIDDEEVQIDMTWDLKDVSLNGIPFGTANLYFDDLAYVI